MIQSDVKLVFFFACQSCGIRHGNNQESAWLPERLMSPISLLLKEIEMFKKNFFLSAVLSLSFSATTICYATPVIIDFEADTTGSKPNGFSAAGFPGVTFTDTIGSDLGIYTGFPTECANSANHCLAVLGDDTSGLRINFDAPVNFLSLDFGNDQSGYVFAGDLGLLTVFLGATQVGQASTVVNVDDIMNQSVGISGVTFDSATFFYTDPSNNPRNLIEVVDNVTYDRVAQVPEPASLALLGVGLAGLGFMRRRRT